MRYIYRFLRSRPLPLFLYTFLLINLIRLGLWRCSFATLQRQLAHLGNHRFPYSYTIGQLLWAIEASCRRLPGPVKCLARALTIQVLMQQQGYPCALRIGVAKGSQGNLQAHAWVEYQGHVIMGNLPDLNRYQSLTQRPS